MIYTGFSRHIDILVDNEGEKPSTETLEHCRRLLGDHAIEKWFNLTGLGYDKHWMYVIGR